MKTSWRAARVAVTAAVLLAMGAGLAFVVEDSLGILTEPAGQSRLGFDNVGTFANDLGTEYSFALQTAAIDRDLAMAWMARVVLFFALAWLVIGMISARTRLVGRPGAAAARASWIASLRPWRARESSLGMFTLDRWLLVLVPGALLVATRGIQTSFLSWVHLAVVLGAWLVFVLVVRLLLGQRSPWPVLATIGGVVVLRSIVTLFALSFTGPGGYWYAFWTDPALRTLYITLAFALFLWVFVAAAWSLVAQFGGRRSVGIVIAAAGAGLAVPSAAVALVGLETALTAWNDGMGLLPWGLSRILGITVYLEIPDASAWVACAFGVLLAGVGVLLVTPWRPRHPLT